MTDTIKGSLWMVGGVFCLTSMAVAGKEISLQIDTFEILFYRSVIGVSIILFFLVKKNQLHEINLKEISTHLKRNVAHFTGQNLWLYALASITLAEVTSLEFTMPIWIVLFSYLMLNEQMDKFKIISVCIGFIGVLITVRPDIESINLGLIAAAISAIVFALTNIYTRRLTRTESTLTILFFLTAMQLIFGLITSLLDGRLDIPTTENIVWIVVIGFAGLGAHYCITTALSLAPPTVVAPIDLLRLPIVVLIGVMFYSEQGDMFIYLGAALIIFANFINLKKANTQ
ncbi:DMT family transporter [Acidimicrobiia bacterium]|nr:DMT family transporter [Acidimicrobiia bacterium]MDA8710309.1 DMT family transporter [Candidatus Actinomarina sp.]MDA8719503.1 DMT family transporter [Candidatus Actinomarina sp.]MDA9198317.1 DMT family transporter [Acidimicrobiia bacterium]MDA9209808.1 DMT family transporter [Acidimicrobiia bacterium]